MSSVWVVWNGMEPEGSCVGAFVVKCERRSAAIRLKPQPVQFPNVRNVRGPVRTCAAECKVRKIRNGYGHGNS